MDSSQDPFDDLLNLEEQYYKEGYDEGFKDGAEAGRVEGYSLGLKKGFEKFVEAGRLQSKAVVWANRIPKYQQRRQLQQQLQQDTTPEQQEQRSSIASVDAGVKLGEDPSELIKEMKDTQLPPIQGNPRLEKNIEMLYGLVEPGTLSMNNDDDAVNDFDSRMKGAHGKLRIIERAVGEGASRNVTNTLSSSSSSSPRKNENIEDVGRIRSPAGPNLGDI